MFTKIGAFNAKTKLSKLLQEVEQGRSYTITLRGHPIANLVPIHKTVSQDFKAAIDDMRNIHKISNIKSDEIAKWIVEGRK